MSEQFWNRPAAMTCLLAALLGGCLEPAPPDPHREPGNLAAQVHEWPGLAEYRAIYEEFHGAHEPLFTSLASRAGLVRAANPACWPPDSQPGNRTTGDPGGDLDEAAFGCPWVVADEATMRTQAEQPMDLEGLYHEDRAKAVAAVANMTALAKSLHGNTRADSLVIASIQYQAAASDGQLPAAKWHYDRYKSSDSTYALELAHFKVRMIQETEKAVAILADSVGPGNCRDQAYLKSHPVTVQLLNESRAILDRAEAGSGSDERAWHTWPAQANRFFQQHNLSLAAMVSAMNIVYRAAYEADLGTADQNATQAAFLRSAEQNLTIPGHSLLMQRVFDLPGGEHLLEGPTSTHGAEVTRRLSAFLQVTDPFRLPECGGAERHS